VLTNRFGPSIPSLPGESIQLAKRAIVNRTGRTESGICKVSSPVFIALYELAGARSTSEREEYPVTCQVSIRGITRRITQLFDVEAHITGTVWKIEVEVGDSVLEGDTVVVLESMKMEMPVEAEDPGVVREVRCQEGQAVAEGDTLVVLE